MWQREKLKQQQANYSLILISTCSHLCSFLCLCLNSTYYYILPTQIKVRGVTTKLNVWNWDCFKQIWVYSPNLSIFRIHLNISFLERQYEDGVDRNLLTTKDFILANIHGLGDIGLGYSHKNIYIFWQTVGLWCISSLRCYMLLNKILLVTEITYINVQVIQLHLFLLAISSLHENMNT